MAALSSVPILNTNGEQVRELELAPQVAKITVQPTLVHQVVVAQLANKRSGTAHTKTRDEVSGGGKKPWKQKGTGRARQGSTRSPQWVGGGIVHGPRNTRNYQQRLPGKLKEKAMQMVVAEYLTSGSVRIVEEFPELTKTKAAVSLLKNLKCGARESCLVLLTDSERNLARGFKNISNVEVMAVRQLNVYDALRFKRWLVSTNGLSQLNKIFV